MPLCGATIVKHQSDFQFTAQSRQLNDLQDRVRLDIELAALARMSSSELQKAWRARFMEEAPDVPASMLARGIAFDLQVNHYGDLPVPGQRMLDRLVSSDQPLPEPDIQIKSGSRLLREWQGKLYTVFVNDNDFVLDGRSYGSLSEIAREITGTRWSGPRFFGIKRRPPPPRRGARVNG